MTREVYEAPGLTVLGSVAELTEQKTGPEPDSTGLDGQNSFNPVSDARLKRDIRAL